MEKAAKRIAPVEEIAAATEKIVAEAKEGAKEASSRLLAKLREFEATWERASPRFFHAPKL